MIAIRRSAERGHANHGWLDTYHTFSFDTYYDPDQMGFRTLRVINEDTVAGGRGFGRHPHRDMEIITYILEGTLEHRDSTGGGGIIRRGDVQRMTAGSGIEHSELNASETDPVRLLQIWILPERRHLRPGYEQMTFNDEQKRNTLRLIASHDHAQGSLLIHQDVNLYASLLAPGRQVTHLVPPGRYAWLQVAAGSLSVNGTILERGDGAAVSGEPKLEIQAREPSEFLLFDLA